MMAWRAFADAVSARASLLVPPREARPSDALVASVEWLEAALMGTLATTICVIAVALVGLTMLTGRLSVKAGARVVLGCFILLGAPVIAGGFMQLVREASPPTAPPAAAVVYDEPADPRGELPPADYNPYAGASLRQD